MMATSLCQWKYDTHSLPRPSQEQVGRYIDRGKPFLAALVTDDLVSRRPPLLASDMIVLMVRFSAQSLLSAVKIKPPKPLSPPSKAPPPSPRHNPQQPDPSLVPVYRASSESSWRDLCTARVELPHSGYWQVPSCSASSPAHDTIDVL